MSRMIDADALGLSGIEIFMCNGDYKEALKMLIDKIERAPTIEDRNMGKWIRMPMACYGGGTITEYECSECSEHQIIESKWCPNCGARMVQKGEDNDRA